MNGRGQGLATFESRRRRLGDVLYNDIFGPGQPFHSAASVERQRAAARRLRAPRERGRVAGGLAGRRRLDPRPDASRIRPSRSTREVELSRPDLGAVPAGQFAVAADRLAGFVVAMAQGPPTSRAITVAVQDRLPGRPGAIAHSAWQSSRRPKLEWRAGPRPVGPAALPRRRRRQGRGRDDGHARSSPDRSASAPASAITYQVIAIDARGQETREPHAQACASTTSRRSSRSGSAASAAPGGRCRIVVKPRDGKGSGVTRGPRALRRLQARASSSASASAGGTPTAGHVHARVTVVRRRRQPPRQEGQAPHHVRLRAGRRELELGGPPLLMGIVNASPDSFSDAGDHPDLRAPARARWSPPGAADRSTSAASRRSAAARRSRRRGDRRGSCRSSRALAARTTCSSRSTPTSRRSPRRRSRRARG